MNMNFLMTSFGNINTISAQQPADRQVLNFAVKRTCLAAALAVAGLLLPGCGGSGQSSDELADERVSVEPVGKPVPEAIADQLMAAELAAKTNPTQAAALQASVQPTEKTAAAKVTDTSASAPTMQTLSAQSFGAYCLPSVTNPIYLWNQQALDAVRTAKLTDAQAARLYAMVNVAMYDAVNGIVSRRGGDRASALVGDKGAPRDGSLTAAASAAAQAVLLQVIPNNPVLASNFAAQYQADLAGLRNADAKRIGANWGLSVGNQVVAARQNDGTALDVAQAPGTGVGEFRASWTGTQFRNMTPFAVSNPTRFIPSGPPRLNSPEYAQAFNNTKLLGNAATPNTQSMEIFQFWASTAGTSQPPGEWIKIALMVSRKKELSIHESSRLMALLGMGLADAVVPMVSAKYNFHAWRPATAIHEADADGNAATAQDLTWAPRAGGIGGTPEYVSGHSVFAGAGSTILRNFFGEDSISFTLLSDGAIAGARSFKRFSEAEAEEGQSRILGGVHFEFSNEDGKKIGRNVAGDILTKSLRTEAECRHDHCSK